MSKHPVTYEHIGILIASLVGIAIVVSAFLYWVQPETAIIPPALNDPTVRSIVCYDKDGTGPMETCPAEIKCFNAPDTNAEVSEVRCPMWPEDSN